MRMLAFPKYLAKFMLPGRIILTAAVSAYVFRKIDWGSLRNSLRWIDSSEFGAAVFMQIGAAAIVTTRWRILLANEAIHMSWLRTFRLSLVGLFFSLFFLGSAGGDVARFAGALPRAAGRKAKLALTLIQDRLAGLGALLLLLTVLFATQFDVLWIDLPMRFLVIAITAATSIFVALTTVLWFLSGSLLAKTRFDTRRWLDVTLSACCASFPKPICFTVLGLSLLNHALVILSGFLVAHALGIYVSLPIAGVIIGVSGLILSLPMTVAGLGVRDGTLIWLFSIYGIRSSASAVGFSFCLLGINLIWASVGGIAFYWPTPSKEDLQ